MSTLVLLTSNEERRLSMMLFILRHPGGLDAKLKEALRGEINRLMTAPARVSDDRDSIAWR